MMINEIQTGYLKGHLVKKHFHAGRVWMIELFETEPILGQLPHQHKNSLSTTLVTIHIHWVNQGGTHSQLRRLVTVCPVKSLELHRTRWL
eukprot:10050804-Ditylum_brightwellii.AAC.2